MNDKELINTKFEIVKKDLLAFKDAFVIKHTSIDSKNKFNEKSNPREWISKFMKLLSNKHSSFIDDHISNDTKVFLKMVPQANSTNEWLICISLLYQQENFAVDPKEFPYEKLMMITKAIEEKITKYILVEFNL